MRWITLGGLGIAIWTAAAAGGWPTTVSWAAASSSLPDSGSAKGAKSGLTGGWPRHILKAERTWQLNLPQGQRFDASGLALTSGGDLWTLNDRSASIYRVQFLPGTNAADLVLLTNCFTPEQLKPLAGEKWDRYDAEGIALDEEGRLYLCEEVNRWILRCDPRRGVTERLPIDWAPVKRYFDGGDLNASFEGVAVGKGRLYVANERQLGRIIVVDLGTLRIVDDFSVRPSGSQARDLHYSDLSFFEGFLYVLLRESRCVLAVNALDHQVVAEYDFRQMEREPEVLYRSLFPTGQMEGLAVDGDSIWLVTDNNGTGRGRYPRDTRPTLFQCRRASLPGPPAR